MLILSRRIGESIIIGENAVEVVVLGVFGNQVKLGAVASREIPVHRKEIYDRIQKEKAANDSTKGNAA